MDGGSGSACGARADHCGGTADLLLPVDEGLHGTHKGIVADDEQMACFNHRRVSVQTLVVVDEVVVIHGLDLRVYLHLVGTAVKDILV